MLYLIMAFLTVCFSLQAEVTVLPGMNLWRLTAGIGSCLDTINSELITISTQLDIAISLTDPLITAINNLASITDSVFDPLSSEIDSVGDILSSQLSVIDTEIASAIDLTSALEPLFPSVSDLFLSSLSLIDLHIESVAETVLDTISIVEAELCTKIETLTECLIANPLHQTDIPFVILEPGVYTVCEDLTLTSGIDPVITILSNNVTLDLQGHTIFIGDGVTGIQTGDPTGSLSIQSVAINNGTVQGDGTLTVPCLTTYYTSGMSLEGITTIDGANIHISFGDASSSVTVDGCQCLGNNGFEIDPNGGAIDIAPVSVQCNSFVISNCYVSSPGTNGIRVANALDVYIQNMEVLGSYQIAFVLTNASTDVIMEHCIAMGEESNFGFDINGQNSAITLRWCIAMGHETGFLIENNTPGSLFVECVAQDNLGGFAIYGTDTVLKRCSVVNNAFVGIFIDASASNTQIFDTCPVNNGVNLEDNGTDTVFIDLETVLEILCSKIETAESDLSELISQLDVEINSVGDLLISALASVVDFTCLTGIVIRQSDIDNNDGTYTITQPGVYTVCEDLTSTGTLLQIMSSDVVLNLNGNLLSAGEICVYCSFQGFSNIQILNGSCTSTTSVPIFIDQNNTNVLVQDITIFNSAAPSVYATTSQFLTFNNIQIYGYNGVEDITISGVAAMFTCADCDPILIENVVIGGFNTTIPTAGMYISDPNVQGTVIRNSIVEGTEFAGFIMSVDISGTLNSSVFENCIASSTTGSVLPGADAGYYVLDKVTGTSGCQLINCIADACINGFVVGQSIGTLLSQCIARNNLNDGYVLFNFLSGNQPSGVFLENCVAHENTFDGFAFGGNSCTSRLCKTLDNGRFGFNITGNGNIVEKALASGNTSSGINNTGANTFLVDNRSSNGATTLNPAYSLNGATDANGTATIITLS